MTSLVTIDGLHSPPCLHFQQHVAIIGAGPAGLMAAEVLAQGGADVTVYDAMPSAGRKFLMAGRGGLNLTHSEPLPAFLARYREAMPHLDSRDRSIPAAGVARLERGAGAGDLRRLQRPGFSKSLQGVALAAGLAAAAGFDGRAVGAASPLDRLGRAGPSALSNAGWTARRRGARDRAGARRRKLAAAGLRRRVGGDARRQRREDIAAAAGQFRLHRRLVGYFSRPLRGPAAQGRGADIRCAHACAAKPSSPAPASRAARSMRCRPSCARRSCVEGQATLHIALRPDLEIEAT